MNKKFLNNGEDCCWNKNGQWLYAHMFNNKCYISFIKPEFGNFAESGYYKGTDIVTDNEGTILNVGDEVAVTLKIGCGHSIRRGIVKRLSKNYAYIDVESWPYQIKFSPQSIIKIGKTRLSEQNEKNKNSYWICPDFNRCETYDCINCEKKEIVKN